MNGTMNNTHNTVLGFQYTTRAAHEIVGSTGIEIATDAGFRPIVEARDGFHPSLVFVETRDGTIRFKASDLVRVRWTA